MQTSVAAFVTAPSWKRSYFLHTSNQLMEKLHLPVEYATSDFRTGEDFLLCYLSSIILVYFCDYFRVALRRHSSKMHKERAGGIPCRRCNIHVSKTAHEGNLHVKECRERFTFDCNECDAKLQTPSHLKTHKELYHDEPKYDCNFCEKKFKRK